MFIYDRPIEDEKDDFLGRKRFSQHLGEALLNWKEKESLVIAIYGEWGSGKSSVINLAINNIKNSEAKNIPTVIEFNPWFFSEKNNLGEYFFNEIAKELEIRNDAKKDKEIAKKIKYYAGLLGLVPDKNLFTELLSKAFLVFGLLGISLSQVIYWLNIPNDSMKNFLLIAGSFFVLLAFLKDFLGKMANYFENKIDYYSKSISEVKKEIKNELFDREKKLIIVIDDIDRLNQSEIRQIFKLIRINADFPNTVYLLAFDRVIIEKNLEEQAGISGEKYLNKIVQVDFNIPLAKTSKISTFLFKELDRILSLLPESAQKYFDQNDPYWVNIYHSGFKNFFKNIRDVKRFASSLEFNISQMYRGEVMEVNPVDFIAIEAIRVFVPDFYLFMRDKNSLFTSTNRSDLVDEKPRKEEIEKMLDKLPVQTKESMVELIKRLFPQVEGLFQYGYSTHGNEFQSIWSKDLRVCAANNFDSYFTLIPGGDENELSQFEIEEVLHKVDSVDNFEGILREYVKKKKIRKILQRIQDFTSDEECIPQSHVKNIIEALFNISDDLPEEKTSIWDFGVDMDLIRIIYQLLKRETDKNKNFIVLKAAILSSKGLFGPIREVSVESPKENEARRLDEFVVPEDKIKELQKICLQKIEDFDEDALLKHKKMLYILYCWKRWDNGKKWENFVEKIEKDEKKLIMFLSKFISESRSLGMGDYAPKIKKEFNYEDLNNFIDSESVKNRLESIKAEDSNDLYTNNKEIIDLYLNNFGKKGQEF